eukprot:78017-Rhodomonas_salina.4
MALRSAQTATGSLWTRSRGTRHVRDARSGHYVLAMRCLLALSADARHCEMKHRMTHSGYDWHWVCGSLHLTSGCGNENSGTETGCAMLCVRRAVWCLVSPASDTACDATRSGKGIWR